MTKSQVKYIIESLCQDSVGEWTKLENCKYFTMTTGETKFCGLDSNIFYFDLDNELVICHPSRKITGPVPDKGIFKQINNEIYELLSDSDTNILADYYPFEEIILFKRVIK